MVGAHIRLYSEKIVTNEMPVEAVHTLSLFKLCEQTRQLIYDFLDYV